MIRRVLVAAAATAIGVACAKPGNVSPSPEPSAGASERQRRKRSAARSARFDATFPMTNTIRRAFAEGTRDSTGRPGRNYWQLQTDYTINARLDPSTSTLTGRETIVLHNNSDSALTADRAAARSEHLPRPTSRAARRSPPRTPTACVITKLTVERRSGRSRVRRPGRTAAAAAGAAPAAPTTPFGDPGIDTTVGAHSACRRRSRRKRSATLESTGTTSCPAARARAIA